VKYGKLPEAEGLLYGIKPVIIAVVVQALWNLGRTAVKTRVLAVVGVGAAALSYSGINPLLILLVAGMFMFAIHVRSQPKGAMGCLMPLLGMTSASLLPAAVGAAAPFSLWLMFLFFLKVGSVLFGSGYVLLAFLRADLVENWHWLTENQLLDAVSVGQFTPGPVFTAATFIGYILGGPQAAFVATVGIFLPSFVLVAISGRFVRYLRKSPTAGAFLDGVNVASLALMAVVAWQLGRVALVDWLTIALAVAAAVWLLCYRVNSTWLILGGAAVGLARFVLATGP
jgi:chromate transporter